TVEVLVAAADGEVGVGADQVHRNRAGRVRQVPQRDRAAAAGGAGERGHVVHAACAVVDVGEHQHGERCIELRSDLLGLDQLEREAVLPRQALGDVEVGGEVAALGD